MIHNPLKLADMAQTAARGSAQRDLVVHSYPSFVYVWPLIILGYLLAGLEAIGLGLPPGVASAGYYAVCGVVLLTIGIPLTLWQISFLVLLGVVGCLNIPYVSDLLALFLYRGGVVEARFALALSNLLAVVYAMMLAYLSVNYYRITQASIVAFAFGQREVATPRVGKQLRAEFPSLLKTVLGLGAGDLVMRDTNGDRELLRISDVPCLFFLFGSIERRLKTFPVSEDDGQG